MTPTPSGDRELYVIDRDWSFPIFADPYSVGGTELMLVQPAVGAEKEQLAALMKVLKSVAAGTSEDGSMKVWIERSVLLTIARKAPGITPSYYFKWPGQTDEQPAGAPVFEPKETLTQNQEAFVDYLVKQCALLDRVQAHMFLQAIRQSGKEWLCYYKRAIDFGLFKVVPLPFRVNWRETLYAIEEEYLNKDRLMPGRLRPMRWLRMLKSRGKRDEWFASQRVHWHLDTKLLDMTKEHWIRWHLNIVEGKDYREYVEKVESDDRRTMGDVRYTKKVVREIQARCGAALDLLSSWAAQIAHACGAVVRKRDAGGQVLVPFAKAGASVPLIPAPPVLPVVVDTEAEFTSPEALQSVEGATKDVRKVLYLQPE